MVRIFSGGDAGFAFEDVAEVGVIADFGDFLHGEVGFCEQLADGSSAVGLFNRSETSQMAILRLSDIGKKGRHVVRDLWRQVDVGEASDDFFAEIPVHGVILVKVSEKTRSGAFA
ncbi:hypothetical protein [Tichowtungia aerotolerans]|uniref:Alpha galactosidase C-terminal domain-containing protein n=1 Tax=Tichowtungia aerotolerans TaxID=2697043 RepID=A0A6P1M1V9_9BACT|nr:hypothetical protein [Tichowtungia aerotolerans]QHI68570.1 hypothetical protein GT409_03595 [Tichowtungia aerotolerans]